MEKYRSSWRVPRLFHLQYLADLLSGINEGLDRSKLEMKLAERKQFFEDEKYKVLGRGHPLMKNLSTARNLLHESLAVASQLNLIGHVSVPCLTADGRLYLTLSGDDQLNFFANRFLGTYKAAPNVLLALSSQPKSEMLLPTHHVRSLGER